MNTREIVDWKITSSITYPSLHPKMLTTEGELRERHLTLNGNMPRFYLVRFDRDYVKHYLQKKVVEALGLNSLGELVNVFND